MTKVCLTEHTEDGTDGKPSGPASKPKQKPVPESCEGLGALSFMVLGITNFVLRSWLIPCYIFCFFPQNI